MENSKKKILLISPVIGNNGITKIILQIIENIPEVEFELAGRFEDDMFPDSIKKYELPDQENVLAYTKNIYQLLKKNDYDALYLHANSAMMATETIVAKLAGCKEVIAHCHNTSSAHKLFHHILKPVFNFVVDKKIACSKTSANWAYLGKNIHIIRNGIDIEKFKYNKDTRKKKRTELHVDENTKLIANLGRLSVQKNQIFLLDIMKEYLKFNEDAKLLLIDDGEQKEIIVEKINKNNLKDKVIFLQKADDVSEYYNAIDIMVMPSLFEGLSLVAIESQANGLPILISDHLSQETYLNKYCFKQSIQDSSEKWACKINEILSSNLERGNVDLEDFRKVGLTDKQMVEEIKSILLEKEV